VLYLFVSMEDSKEYFVASLPALCYTCDLAGAFFRTRVMQFTPLSTHALSHAPTLGSFELHSKNEKQ